jgi:hypothetical protein
MGAGGVALASGAEAADRVGPITLVANNRTMVHSNGKGRRRRNKSKMIIRKL